MRAPFATGRRGRLRTIQAIVTMLVLCLGWATEAFVYSGCSHHSLPGPTAAHHQSAGSHAGHSGNGSEREAPDVCTCIGACATTAAAGLPAASVGFHAIDAMAAVELLGRTSVGPLQRDRYTLPYATAPPAV